MYAHRHELALPMIICHVTMGRWVARPVCCTMRKMYGFVARRGFVSSDFNEIGELLMPLLPAGN